MMMRKENRTFKMLLCFLLCAMLAGCWDRTEPKNMALVSSAVYDLKDDGNYQITIEITNPTTKDGEKKGTGGKSTSIMYVGENLSIPESARGISQSLDKSLFSSHTKVRFLSEKFARTDIVPVFDYLLRSYHLDENPLVVIIKDEDPSKIYTCDIGLSETVGGYIESISNSLPFITSKSVFTEASDFIKDYYWNGKQPVAGVVEFVPNNAPSSKNSEDSQKDKFNIKYEGLAAFKDNKLVGFLNGVEARSYNFVTNNLKTALVSILTENHYTVFMVDQSKSKIKTFIQDGQITIDVKINVYISTIQESGSIDVTQMDSIKMLENQVNQLLEKETAAAIQKVQTEFKSDIFGFGIYVHAEHPQQWKDLKYNWDEQFSKANIHVMVDSSIRRTGQIKQPFREEEK